MRNWLVMVATLAMIAGLSGGGPASAATLDDDAKAFGSREAASSLDLSPSGSKVVMLSPGPGHATLIKLVDLTTGSQSLIGGSSGAPDILRWCRFADDSQLVCRFTANMVYEGEIVGFSRLVTMGIDGKNVKSLGQRSSFRDAYLRQQDGAILDWLPGKGGALLMERAYVPEIYTLGTNIHRDSDGLGVDRIDLRTLRTTTVEPPRRDVDHFITDGQGNIRVKVDVRQHDNDGQLTGITTYSYRPVGSGDWKRLGDYDERSGAGMRPLAIEASSNSLYFLRKVDGRDALFKMPLDGSGVATRIAANPHVDIDGVVRAGRGEKVVGYTYAEDSRRARYFDPDYAGLEQSLARALPDAGLIDFASWNGDGTRLLVFGGSDVAPGTYYLLDRATKQMRPLFDVRPGLQDRKMSPVKSISFAARDGQTIPAYLTIPAGSSGKNMPAIVLPHGGPSARDEWGFDWLPQFLAARGYVVIQPQYRGSAGFGDEFRNVNGFRNWSTSIADINDAAHFLAKGGIADPSRIAIVGWSYGGYAALQAVATDPTLFKAVVAIAPVTDLTLLKNEEKGFADADLLSDFVGGGKNARNGSPLRNATAIRVPVLLVHGDMDSNVGIAHSLKMQAALQGQGTAVELLRYKALDHQLDDSDARTEMLSHIGALLERTIGH